MTGHDPRAVDVLAGPGGMGTATIRYALDALTAAGLVVRPADEYVPSNCADCGCAWGSLFGLEPDRLIYVRKDGAT